MNSSDSQDKIILSICLIGRNDDYGKDFKRRLQQSINFLAYSAEKAGVLDKIEVLLTDWNSDTPLAEAVNFSPAAAKIMKFIEVPPDVARKHNYGDTPFHISKSLNVGFRRASGRYVGMMPGDILISEFTLERLIKLLTGKLTVSFDPSETLLGVPRKFIPHYGEEQRFFKNNSDIERILVLNDFYLKADVYPKGLMGGYGFLIMSRELCFKAEGVDETLGGWGGSDIELALRLSCSNPLVNLSGLGIVCYDFEPNRKMVSEKNVRISSLSKFATRIEGDMNWGLGNEIFTITPAKVGNAPSVTESNLILLDRILDKNFRYKLLWESRKISLSDMKNITPDAVVIANVASQIYPARYLAIGNNDVSNGLAVSLFSPLSELFFVSNDGENSSYFSKIGSALCGSRHVGDIRYFPFPIEKIIAAKFGKADEVNICFDLVSINLSALSNDFGKNLPQIFQFASKQCTWIFNYSGYEQQLAELKDFMNKAFPQKEIIHSYKYHLIIWADLDRAAIPNAEKIIATAWQPFTGNFFSRLFCALVLNKDRILKALLVLFRQKLLAWPRTIRMIAKY